MYLVKRLAARLPDRWQADLKRLFFRRQILGGRFVTDEQEFGLLPSLVRPGDWVLDVGANIGHYTKRLSDLVGPTGRVIAFEPVPATFALLATNAQLFTHRNVTLLNAAASDRPGLAGIELPEFTPGLTNFYQAHLSAGGGGGLSVITMPIDALQLQQPVALAKIDVEGHEAAVVTGMQTLLRRFRPVLIVETSSEAVIEQVCAIGYSAERLPGSSNVLLRPSAAAAT